MITYTFLVLHRYQSAPTKLMPTLPASSCSVYKKLCVARPVLTFWPSATPLPPLSTPLSISKPDENEYVQPMTWSIYAQVRNTLREILTHRKASHATRRVLFHDSMSPVLQTYIRKDIFFNLYEHVYGTQPYVNPLYLSTKAVAKKKKKKR